MSKVASPPGHFTDGRLWQKSYGIPVPGPSPEEVTETWMAKFGDLWYPDNKFYAPVGGIAPGQVAIIAGGRGPTKVISGVRVIYADERSWTHMTPEGHPWTAIITFSAHEAEGATRARIDLMVRANDPLYEVSFHIYTSRLEDKIWTHMLTELAATYGSKGPRPAAISPGRQAPPMEGVAQYLEELRSQDPSASRPSLSLRQKRTGPPDRGACSLARS
ncbi:MAG TPA: hypothetical protein VEB69_06150 [Acidimicrobiia bacterium]|nr:hypothetical protein [Acidimicrobiia bacterium]